MSISQGDTIAAFHMSATSSDHILVLTQRGRIIKFDWRTAQKVQSWETGCAFLQTSTCIATVGEPGQDVIISATKKRGNEALTAFVLDLKSKQVDVKPKILLDKVSSVSNFAICDNGKTIIASSGNKLLVGITKSLSAQASEFLVFIWREVALPSPITSLDAREHAAVNIQTPSKKAKKEAKVIDIAVGLVHGDILVYEDFVGKLLALESPSVEAGEIDTKPRRLHWHRKAVQTVRWSVDGNYLISGGSETVLVLWQLDTNAKQFVPHLSSTVVNLVVSPSGASYAVMLADNCTIILSTADLKATANIAGLQLPALDAVPSKPVIAEKSIEDKEAPKRHATALLHPVKPERLLVAVPASQSAASENTGYPRAALLQTFDISANAHISQQALARTNTTAREYGPDGAKVTEPEIKHMQISSNGQWLATIDQWRPNPNDTSALYVDSIRLDANAERREIYLKFWSWNTSTNEWELVTRVDMPHRQSRIGLNGVLDLAIHPHQTSFVSIGEDATVRFWAPFDRNRNGVPVKDSEGRTLVTWNTKAVLDLEGTNTSSEQRVPKHASLAFSEDGSVLAASWQSHHRASNKAQTVIHLIDTATAKIQHTLETPQLTGSCAVGFVGRYLIILGSNAVQVWDIVDFKLKYSFDIPTSKTSTIAAPNLLATNSKDQTFAIACASSPNDTTSPILTIFSPASPNPLFHLPVGSSLITAVLPDIANGGYVTLDTAAEIRRHTSSLTSELSSALSIPTATDGAIIADASEATEDLNLSALFGGVKAIAGSGSGEMEGLTVGGDQSVVQKQQLSEVFDVGPSFAMPSVSVLFERVAGLFVGVQQGVEA